LNQNESRIQPEQRGLDDFYTGVE